MTVSDYITLPRNISRLDFAERHRAVLAIGTRWEDLLRSFESGVNYVAPDLSATICFAAIRPFAFSGYSDEYVTELAVHLHRACAALERYLSLGMVEDDMEDLPAEAIDDFLETDINHCVWNLLTDRKPCARCARQKARGEDWNPAEPGGPFCTVCRAERRTLNERIGQ